MAEVESTQSANRKTAMRIFEQATPVIRISGVGGGKWKRNVAKGARIGPWLQAQYEILDNDMWHRREPCLYLVGGADDVLRYAGISRNRLKDRWRLSPAYDAESMARLPVDQLFHSQCWKNIEAESISGSGTYEVRAIHGLRLLPVLEKLGPPLSAFAAFADDGEGMVAGVERWLCNRGLLKWNISMSAGSGMR